MKKDGKSNREEVASIIQYRPDVKQILRKKQKQ
jgi:hypothetical protein